MRKTKFFAMLVTIAMLVTLVLPFGTFAEDEYVARVGGKDYPNLESAIAALNETDNTLELLRNVNVIGDSTIAPTAPLFTFPSGTVTIEGNNHKITVTGKGSTSPDVSLFDIVANCNITVQNLELDVQSYRYVFRVGASSNLVFDNATVTSKYALAYYNGNGATVHIKGGKYTYLDGNGALINGAKGGVNNNTLVIDDGVFSSTAYIINVSGTDVTINGGSFSHSSKTYPGLRFQGSGDVAIAGGVFRSELHPVMWGDGSTNVNIYDGYFYGVGSQKAYVAMCNNTTKIYGGTFVTDSSDSVIEGTADASKDSSKDGKDHNITPIEIYGGQYYNYNNTTDNSQKLLISGKYHLNGGYLFAANIGQSVTEENAVKDENGENVTIDGLCYTVADNLKGTDILTGASVRLVENSQGIRFESFISKATLDYVESIKDEGTEIKYGTIITPTDYLTGNDTKVVGLTFSVLKSVNQNPAYVDIEAKVGSEQRDDGILLRAALVNLQSGNNVRNFSANVYISYVKDGHTVYLYGAYNETENSRSMEQVATAALDDPNAQFTDAQRVILNGYLSTKAD